jgi:hypothetical protein
LVFLHQRKSGGSNVRNSLDAYAAHQGLQGKTAIACKGKFSCLMYEIPSWAPPKLIYAFHASWNTLWPLFQPKYLGAPQHNVGKVKFTCFTIFRDPVARVKKEGTCICHHD